VVSRADVLDLDAFLAIHPWPEDLRKLGKPLEWLWNFEMEGDLTAIWNRLTDTSRLYRALGIAEVVFQERKGALHGATRLKGFRHEWIEDPWEWVAGRWLQQVRRYTRGLTHVHRCIFGFQPIGRARVRYYVYFGWIPRNPIGALGARIGMPALGRGFARLIPRIERELKEGGQGLLTVPPRGLSEAGRVRLATVRAALIKRLGASEMLERLIEHVTTSDDVDLYRIQVPALARAWGVDEEELLYLCLHGTREGLLELSWDVICPHCRGVREEVRSLGNVPRKGSCEVCDIEFATDKDMAIEITFHVHPAIREVPKRLFCLAELSSKMHIRVQMQVRPGAEATVQPCLEPGRYRLRLRGQERYRFLDVTGDAGASQAGADQATPVMWRASQDGDLCAGADPRITLINDTQVEQQFVLEAVQWADLALRPARLFNFQKFRDLFSEEYLAADVQLSVGEQTILFTDMVGSSSFYARRGDPEAFVEIKRHFVELYEIVAARHGAVIKTIGDAVMAAFSSPVDALEASRRIHQRFHQDREDTPIRLRISLNTGPCIAVNLNSNIDYFGSTVNLAAKLQACASAGQIAMSAAVADRPEVRAYLDEQGARLERTAYRSSALDQTIPVMRWFTFS
jgi:class 3 adenylate cyclase